MIIDTKLNFLIWDWVFRRHKHNQKSRKRSCEEELQKCRKTNAELSVTTLSLQVRLLVANMQKETGIEPTDILFNSEFYRALVPKVKAHAPTLLSFGDADTPDLFVGLNVSTHIMMPVNAFYVGTAEVIAERITMFNEQYATRLDTSPIADEISSLDKGLE